MKGYKLPDINSITIAGMLTSDPERHQTSTGETVMTFNVLSNRKYRDNSGIWRENSCDVGVVVHQSIIDACQETLHEKSAVLIDGEMIGPDWRQENSTNRNNVVEILAKRIQFLDAESNQVIETVDQPYSGQTVPDLPEKENPEEKQVEPTSYDFGYRNLKL
jgi:single-strand DNA-binding protein